MTNEEKQLLFKDLCGRLPYGVKFPYHKEEDSNHRECDCVATLYSIDEDSVEFDYSDNGWEREWSCTLSEVKPYLRPLSSMTEEELKDYAKTRFQDDKIWEIVEMRVVKNEFVNVKCRNKNNNESTWIFQIHKRDPLETWEGIDWLNFHHFDYRGLITKGLALEAPEGMYKID